ncbi:MAG: DUF1232 domain-containing protein [Desulfobacterium sp.]|nr:DUF1232 domain-containing protein [Desulfobacterium sp.]MBU3948391.1 DUF1232 domain-containing protein [Pseudomonadota bacterium]MBU4010301.1 DUF1232 domain-containing protein [Pseudomonadota bacterium]MBU4036859.1 DUF1232 domain-containing protein [Pseudomonadota bacterium]
MQKIIIVCLGIISLMYLLNIGVGVIEVIPDNIPFIGNLDEGSAALLLLMCLRYFGLDLTNIFKNSSKTNKNIE